MRLKITPDCLAKDNPIFTNIETQRKSKGTKVLPQILLVYSIWHLKDEYIAYYTQT